MMNYIKRNFVLLGIGVGSIFLITVLIFFGLKDGNLKKVSEEQNSQLTYVLVCCGQAFL